MDGGRGRTIVPDRVLIMRQATIFSSNAVVDGVGGQRCTSGRDFA